MQKRLLLLMVFMALMVSAMAQKTITGTVTDENDTPLPGVTIVVKNTTIGTVSDVDGKFTLSVPESDEDAGNTDNRGTHVC